MENTQQKIGNSSLNTTKASVSNPVKTASSTQNSRYIQDMPVEHLVPNRYQPRVAWKPEKLMELADSIRANGVIEPLIVTRNEGNKYEVIAGERRLRASKMAGLRSVPVIVKETSPQQMLELAVVENIQRADLNPLEEAIAFFQLNEEFGLTHEEIAEKIGYSRPAVANKVRLLSLPDEVKKGILEEKISEGHARAILGLNEKESMTGVYEKTVKENMSVRATEELVRKLNLGKRKKIKMGETFDTLLVEHAQTKFGSRKCRLKKMKRALRLEIDFKSQEDLKDFLENSI